MSGTDGADGGDDLPVEACAKKARLHTASDAIIAGDVKLLQSIFEADNDTKFWEENVGETEEEEGWTLLHLAVAKGQAGCVEFLVKNVPSLVTKTSRQRSTPLLLAVRLEKDLDVFKALLQGEGKKAVNLEAMLVNPPLWEAFRVERPGSYAVDLVNLLIANGAKYSKCLRGPIIGKNVEVVKLMLNRGCSASAIFENDYERQFPVYAAAEKGCLDILKVLLPLDRDAVKRKTRDGDTALMAAARNGHANCVELLISAGASPTVQNRDGICPLYLAACHGKAEVVKVLLKQKQVKAMAKKMSNWRSELHPLTEAVVSGSAETVRLLVNSNFCRYDLYSPDNEIEMNADLDDQFCIDWNCLDLISYALNEDKGETEEIVHFLIDAGFHLEPRWGPGPLAVAVMQMPGNEESMERVIRHILEAGDNLEYSAPEGQTNKKALSAPQALVVAISARSQAAVRLLLQYWWREPAQMLVLYESYRRMRQLRMDIWFPILAGYGLPHGDPMIKLLKNAINDRLKAADQPPAKHDGWGRVPSPEPDANTKKELFTSFLQQMETPSSLQQLTRFAIRKCCWKKALKVDMTLPTYLKKHIPVLPEVMSYLLMEVP